MVTTINGFSTNNKEKMMQVAETVFKKPTIKPRPPAPADDDTGTSAPATVFRAVVEKVTGVKNDKKHK